MQCSWPRPATTARPAAASARSPRPPPRPAGSRSARATAARRYRPSTWRSAPNGIQTGRRQRAAAGRAVAEERHVDTARAPGRPDEVRHRPRPGRRRRRHRRGRLPGQRRDEPRQRQGRPAAARRRADRAARRRRRRGGGRARSCSTATAARPRARSALDDRVKLPIVVLPGDQGAAAAATLLTGGAVHDHVLDARARTTIRQAGSVAAFSSTGLAFDDSIKPDLVAPGVAVTTSAPGGRYLAESGTSVAAAQVAGVAALVLQAHPTWAPRIVRGALVGTATRRRRRRGRSSGRRGAGRRRGQSRRRHGGLGRRRAVVADVRPGARGAA